MCTESNLKVKDFIKSEELRNFYMLEINDLLKDYEPGNISHKQDVLNEIKRRDELHKNKGKPDINLIEALRQKTAECFTLKDKLSTLLKTIKDKNLQEHFI
jgi:predicted component of type VI protein secretion system